MNISAWLYKWNKLKKLWLNQNENSIHHENIKYSPIILNNRRYNISVILPCIYKHVYNHKWEECRY